MFTFLAVCLHFAALFTFVRFVHISSLFTYDNLLDRKSFKRTQLLDDSDSEEYIEMSRNRTKSVNSDDFFLQETRTWTSVRDRHLQGLDNEVEHEINNEEPEKIVHLNLSDD